MLTLHTVIASTRPGRAGAPVGRWFHDAATRDGRFACELVDLAEVNLPLMDEPKHPRFRDYQHAHTRAWSAKVAAADAFVFVTPEYNYSAPPSLTNALDYLFHEWNYKPCAFVSYGGVSGGVRSVQMLKQTVTALKMMPIPEGVMIPFVAKRIDGSGVFTPVDVDEKAAKDTLSELLKWAGALATLRRG